MSDATPQILLITRDAAVGERIESLFTEVSALPCQFGVQIVAHVEAGLALAHRQEFSAMMLDLGAGGDSVELIDRVRRGAFRCPVIFLGSGQDAELVQDARTRGAADFLPLDRLTGDLLTKTIRAAIQQQSLGEEIERQLRLLSLNQNALRSIVEHTADGILILSPDGLVRYANPSALSLFGLTQSQIDELPIGLPAELKTTLELELRGKSGARSVVEVRFVEMIWDGDSSVLASLRDITRHKQLQAELEAALAAAKEARHAAEAASQHKSEFLARMSHEIRTPLNGVIGMTSILLASELTAEHRSQVEIVHASSEMLLDVINDVLDFSKIEAGKIEMERVAFDPRQVLEDTIALFSESAAKKGVLLANLATRGIPVTVEGDPVRLRQILANLISNALKFTARGTVVARLRVESEADGDVVLRCEVEDSGIGISAEAKPRLFAAFSQADTSTTRRYGGTGLGLAICHRLAGLMGGAIGVESAVGVGSTFWFTVRFARVAPTVTPSGFFDVPDAALAALVGKRILIASRNEPLRRLLSQQISLLRARCHSLSDPRFAIAMMRDPGADEHYDLLVLDAPQPVVAGLSAVVFDSNSGLLRQSSVYRRVATALGIPVDLPPRGRAAAAPTSFGTARRRFATVLVAEDNEVNQRVASEMLTRLGVRVEVVGNGRLAVEAFAASRYDAVFMDCEMPEMDGYEATQTIRKLPGGRETPIIAMTAYAFSSDRDRCLQAGMSDFLAKPVRLGELERVLDRWLAGEGVGAWSAPALDDGSRVASGPLPHLDRNRLNELRALTDEEFVASLVTSFLASAPALCRAIRAAIERTDAKSLANVAHTFKGSAGNVGARILNRVAAELEERARATQLDGCEDLVGELERELPAVAEALEREQALWQH